MVCENCDAACVTNASDTIRTVNRQSNGQYQHVWAVVMLVVSEYLALST